MLYAVAAAEDAVYQPSTPTATTCLGSCAPVAGVRSNGRKHRKHMEMIISTPAITEMPQHLE